MRPIVQSQGDAYILFIPGHYQILVPKSVRLESPIPARQSQTISNFQVKKIPTMRAPNNPEHLEYGYDATGNYIGAEGGHDKHGNLIEIN